MDRADLSVREVEATLETELAQHAELARFHREKSNFHTAELRRLEEDLKNFRAVVSRLLPSQPAEPEPPGLFPSTGEVETVVGEEAAQEGKALSVAVAETLDKVYGDTELFDRNEVTTYVNALYIDQLGAPVDSKQVSNVLRRMLADGKIHIFRVGRPRHPAVYSKMPPKKKEDSNNADVQERSE